MNLHVNYNAICVELGKFLLIERSIISLIQQNFHQNAHIHTSHLYGDRNCNSKHDR